MASCLFIIVTITLAAILITSIVLMAKSFAVVKYNTIALKKDVYSRAIEKNMVYRPGR